jgi:putative membrane protein
MMYYYDTFFPFNILGFFINIIFLIIVIAIVIRLIRGGSGYHHYYKDRSMEILKERYAKGEITKEQFEQMKKDLS